MHIFISYAKKDTLDLAKQLRDALEAVEGITAWMDESIMIGGSWAQQIQQEIDRCDLVVVLLSPDVNRDPANSEGASFVLTEINYALYEAGKPVIPVMAQASRVPLQLAGVQRLDLTQNGMDVLTVVKEVCSRGGITIPRAPLSVQSKEEKPPISSQNMTYSELLDVTSILPLPFEWCEIPTGKVTLKDANNRGGTQGGTYEIAAFAIAKYPITNAQYETFVTANNGYSNSEWWNYSREAQTWRTKNPQPLDTAFPGDNLPRTRVTWYEAVAFCRWLSSSTNRIITLPTEEQWQRAAQGDDQRAYPWGEEFDPGQCNTWEGNTKTATSVLQYPSGGSPFGVMDMSGNMWEWCLSIWGTNDVDLRSDSQRVTRGGSWFSNLHDVRCDTREYRPPNLRNHYFSFRIVCIER